MEVIQTDNGKEFSGDKKGPQYDHFCQKERIFHRRGADYTPQHQSQGERANQTVKRLLRKVRRQTGLPPYTEKWLFQGVVQELNNCVSTVTGKSPVCAFFGEERAAEILSITVGNRMFVYDVRPRKKDEEPVYGVEGFFGGIENSNVVKVIIRKDNGWKPIRVPPSSVSLVAWRSMDRKLFDSSLSSPGESKRAGGQGRNMNDSFSSYSSSLSLSGVSPGLGGKGRGSDEVDDGAFSDVDVEEVPCDAGDCPPAKFSSSLASARFFPSVSHTAARLCECYVTTSVSLDIGGAQPFSFLLQSPAGIQIQTGQLEMHAQQEGGEEGEREEREEAERDSEPRRGARRLPKREEREDGGGVPPSPIAEDVEVDWGVDSDGNTLRMQEDREEVQAAQDDEKKEEALRERLGKLKEELAHMIAEKEKKRRPLPRIVPVDPTVVKKMISHVNPRKGHIDATNEEVESGSHKKGMVDELQRFLDETVFHWGVHVPKGRKVMRCRWVLTWKLKGGKRVTKARLVVKGFQNDRKDLQTYSGMADWWSVLLVLLFAATKGWGYAKSDVRTVFLTAEMKDEVYVRLPDKLPAGLPEWMKAGSVFRLNKAMYGLKDAPRLYTQSFRKMAKEEGWEELRESVFVKKDEQGEIIAIILMHVDDLLIFAADPLIHFVPIQKRLKMDDPELLEEGESFEYVEMTLTRTREGYKIGQKAYLDSIEIDEKKLLGGRLNTSLLEPPEEGEVLEDLIPLMQKCTGVTGY
uniref:Integrase catalytic domain-containing protein n=1 Tax=Chromera velia CCMP2878 TaxID=1169474 RepID=A0A0G4H0Q3_9ALVE|eukprot:Cvel_24148.t1-p1 / transcript=Cvel_24148.t1 / gene=Cvel_24148 / organism=Chromera_velia_CCMP2878 / gene_product=Retrovirus-related Pol polyprotein from transposon, putative / transcript_product=Retrovirus-related Pol polyprotein from transposon, putative / location=Cvel_scaffold2577:8180-11691(+) / protein_length=747 / sequence_SO=supercontig / SO=protein_coding / is_pseudo=false